MNIFTKLPFIKTLNFHLTLCLCVASVLSVHAQNTYFTLKSPLLTQVTFNNQLIENETINVLAYQYLYNGGGVAVGDLNNDGLPDLFFSGNMVSDKLYINKGNLIFNDITQQAGLTKTTGWSCGVTMVDINSDGLLDIYVCRTGPFSTANRCNKLYINNGDLTFTDKAKEYGLNDSAFSTQAAFFDMDMDGDLDMFLLNHAVTQTRGFSLQEIRNQRDIYAGNKLFRNENNHFIDISAEAGIYGSPINFGLGIVIGDINNDNYPDIFVTNDYNETDFLYLNNTNGTFTETLQTAFGHTSNFSMGCDLADINNDGLLDLFVVDMLPEDNYRQKILQGPTRYDKYQIAVDYGYGHQVMHNTLQINNGNGSFSEIANSAGIAATDWSWAPLIADFDNDGFQDIYITNGYRRDFTDMDFMKYTYADEEKIAFTQGKKINTLALVEKMPSVKVSNYMYSGNKNLVFENKTSSWGLNKPSFSNGAIYADLDNDGDLDIVINNINDTAFIYENNSNTFNNNHFLEIQLIGEKQNINAIGSRVIISAKGKTLTREVMPTRGYASSTEAILHFGLGDVDAVDLEIIFSDKKSLTLNNIPTNQRIIIAENQAQITDKASQNKKQLFKDESNTVLLYKHKKENYIDFKREPLLPYKLSDCGPALAKGDINGDKIFDIYIGASKNNKGQLFLGDEAEIFIPLNCSAISNDSIFNDVDAQFFDADNDGDLDLFVVSGGNTSPENSENYQDRLYINDGTGQFVHSVNNIPQNKNSNACIKTCDFDGDGDEDIFIGGKLIPRKFPLSPPSLILENQGGFFTDVTEKICQPLLTAGMINDALWVDVNQDNKPDLILVGDWMPIRIFINKGNRFEEATEQYTLANTSGWWNTIAAADMDNDGDLDLVVGNRGTNNQIRASIEKPVLLYNYDFDSNGSIDPILTYFYNDNIAHPYASHDDLLDQIPMLKKKFIFYKDYGNATIQTLFPELNINQIPTLKTEIFESVYLEQQNGKFILHQLPRQAQWFNINSILLNDFNGDGNLDIIAAGNNYDIRPELGRIDAGYGLFLSGDGKGNFNTISSSESGLYILGETKNIQLIEMKGKKYIIIAKYNGYVQTLLINN